MVKRVITTLSWAVDWLCSGRTDGARVERCLQLQMCLLRLLHDLLIGHFSDNALEIGTLSAGLPFVLHKALGAAAFVDSLAVAWLQRLKHDVSAGAKQQVYDQDGVLACDPAIKELAKGIWQLLGKHSMLLSCVVALNVTQHHVGLTLH